VCSGPDNPFAQVCLAVAYHFLNRPPDATANFAKVRSALGDTATFQYAQINAQRGGKAEALTCLASAYKLRDSGPSSLKVDRFLDPIRNEPQFKDIKSKLNFPP
jgi:hypothetical protein